MIDNSDFTLSVTSRDSIGRHASRGVSGPAYLWLPATFLANHLGLEEMDEGGQGGLNGASEVFFRFSGVPSRHSTLMGGACAFNPGRARAGAVPPWRPRQAPSAGSIR